MHKVVKGFVVGAVATIALLVAQTSAHACVMWWLYEPPMPESLIQND